MLVVFVLDGVDDVLNRNGIRNGLAPTGLVVVEKDSPDETNPNKTTDVVNRRPLLLLVLLLDVVVDLLSPELIL